MLGSFSVRDDDVIMTQQDRFATDDDHFPNLRETHIDAGNLPLRSLLFSN
jgi:hypothetical protein